MIEIDVVTFQNYLQNSDIWTKDKYGILKSQNLEAKLNTLVKNPYIDKLKDSAFITRACVDGIIGGVSLSFTTKLKLNNKVVFAKTGSSLYVEERYRKEALGMYIMLNNIENHAYDYSISAGLSKMAYPLYKKLRYACLDYPLLWQCRNVKILFSALGKKNEILNAISAPVNLLLKCYYGCVNKLFGCSLSKFRVIKLSDVPQWIADVATSDGHKYMEYHDKSWFEWTLNNNFRMDEDDIQSLFAITKDGRNIGFFMTKERTLHLPERNLAAVRFGSITEWGTVDEKELSESDIYKLAVRTFSRKVDIVEFSTGNKKAIKKMKFMGFWHQHGESHIAFKDYSKNYKDADDPNLWRFRLSYADVMFY